MTDQELYRILREWQNRLRLGHWDIKLRFDLPVEKDNDAEIRISDDYEQASIRIQTLEDPATEPPLRPFRQWTDEEANRVLVHELLHIFEKQTKRPLEQFLPDTPKPVHDLLWAWYTHGAENWVDRLAIILIELGGLA